MNITDYLELDSITIKNILNRRNSTRSLTFEQFESIVDRLASELSDVDYTFNYTNQQLITDWNNLKKEKIRAKKMSSTKRTGMKLVEHFFPNVWEVENNKGNSFCKYWQDEDVLRKVLRWNRKSHSTPYLSELRRGIYFCTDLPKTTLYRPLMAKAILDFYKCKRVLDPCAGWGGRMLGTCVDSSRFYVGFEPNTTTYKNLNRLSNFLKLDNFKIIHDGAENMSLYGVDKGDKFDCVLTSPPYFDLEVYSNESSQSITDKNYGQWLDNWLKPLILNSTNMLSKDGISCWNTANVGKYKLDDVVQEYHKELGFKKINEFTLVSSKRQVNKTSKKNQDKTMVFRRE